MKTQKIIKIAGYVFLVLFALLFNLYLTFPDQAVGQRISYEVRKATNGRINVAFEHVTFYRLTGFSAQGVTLRFLNDNFENQNTFTYEKMKARLRLLPLFLARLSFDIEILDKEGKLHGRFWQKPKGVFEMELQAKNMDMAKIPIQFPVPVQGKITGNVETLWDSVNVQKSTGKANLSFKAAGLGPGMVQGFTLPSANLGDLNAVFNITEGRLRVSSFTQKGGQVLLQLTGGATLRPQFSTSLINFCVLLKGEEQFLIDNPNMRSAFQLAEVSVQKDGNGFLNLPLVGSFAQPSLRNGLCREAGR